MQSYEELEKQVKELEARINLHSEMLDLVYLVGGAVILLNFVLFIANLVTK